MKTIMAFTLVLAFFSSNAQDKKGNTSVKKNK